MSTAHLHSASPDYWVGALGYTVGAYLTGQATRRDLDGVYDDLRRSRAVTADLRRILPDTTPSPQNGAKKKGRKH